VTSYFPERLPEIVAKALAMHRLMSDLDLGILPPPPIVAPNGVRPLPLPVTPPLESVKWCEGYDGEYEYSVDIHADVLVWRLEFDKQWTDAPRHEVQTRAAFAAGGPPEWAGTRCPFGELRTALSRTHG
jgi:hypothetical protein